MPNNPKMLKKKIKLIAYDFDGVMTNNKVYIDQNGNEINISNKNIDEQLEELTYAQMQSIIQSLKHLLDGSDAEFYNRSALTSEELQRIRIDAPKNDYDEIISEVVRFIKEISSGESNFTVGIGMPGSIHPQTNLVQVSNTQALENKSVKADLETQLGYEIKIANDADCLALSEAIDGAGEKYRSVFAVILGTGVGAGFSLNKKIVIGPNRLTGEWGQNPIPGPMDNYEKSVKRHCGRVGAIEVFISGPGLENHYNFVTNSKKSSREIVSLFKEGDFNAEKVMDIYFERIARSFSTFVNILDPDVIVCGGGMSEVDAIYEEIPKRIISYIASNYFLTPIVKAKHGSSSGVRGAAHLWN